MAFLSGEHRRAISGFFTNPAPLSLSSRLSWIGCTVFGYLALVFVLGLSYFFIEGSDLLFIKIPLFYALALLASPVIVPVLFFPDSINMPNGISISVIPFAGSISILGIILLWASKGVSWVDRWRRFNTLVLPFAILIGVPALEHFAVAPDETPRVRKPDSSWRPFEIRKRRANLFRTVRQPEGSRKEH